MEEIKHGTNSAYSHQKCRCEVCRNFWNKYQRELREAKRVPSPPKPGVDNHGAYGYNRGCRCDTCKLARKELYALQRKQSAEEFLKTDPSKWIHGIDETYRKGCRCKECKNRHSARNRMQSYGITFVQFNEMREEQNFRCRICGKHESMMLKGLHVDHDHATGQVRALLCSTCNTGLGSFQDDPKLLRLAIKYLNFGW